MKKILAIAIMMMMTACAKPIWQPKPVVCSPSQGLTQEQVLKEARNKQEVKIFREWWNGERMRFQAFLISQVRGVQLAVTTVSIDFMDNYNFAIVHVKIIFPSPQASQEGYIVVTRKGGVWGFTAIIGKNTVVSEEAGKVPDTRLEAGSDHEYKL